MEVVLLVQKLRSRYMSMGVMEAFFGVVLLLVVMYPIPDMRIEADGGRNDSCTTRLPGMVCGSLSQYDQSSVAQILILS